MAESQQGGERYNREGLAEWASGRFSTSIPGEQFEGRSRADIARMLLDISRAYFEKGRVIDQLDKMLDKACPRHISNGHSPAVGVAGVLSTDAISDQAAAVELVEWANHEFQSELDAASLKTTNRRTLGHAVRWAYERKYRPELYQAERSVILDTLDGSWKDHLYFMDHLRSGIGLVGYAQKDPKTEYRREGMAAFEQMWDRIAAQVTGTIFRIEVQIPESSGSVWQITSTEHASPVEDIPDDHPALSVGGGHQPGDNAQPIDPIRNFGDRIGRNDPCPCGSGKKYKKCHGAG
jgi:preprotein translocase subunit SecA